MKFETHKRRAMRTGVYLAVAMACSTAGAWSINSNTEVFTCEIRPVVGSSNYLFIASDKMRIRRAYAQTVMATVAPGTYVLMDPQIQKCAAQYNTGVSSHSSSNCDPYNMDNKAIYELQYTGTGSGNRAVFRLYNLHSKMYVDTWGNTGNNAEMWQNYGNSSNNQKFYVQNCMNPEAWNTSPAAR